MLPKVGIGEMETAVKKHLKGEGQTKEIAARLGVDRNTVYRWKR